MDELDGAFVIYNQNSGSTEQQWQLSDKPMPHHQANLWSSE